MWPKRNRRSIIARGAIARRGSANTVREWKLRRQLEIRYYDYKTYCRSICYGVFIVCCPAVRRGTSARSNSKVATGNNSVPAEHCDTASQHGRYFCWDQKTHRHRTQELQRQKVSYQVSRQ